jgi:hypothetical protein
MRFGAFTPKARRSLWFALLGWKQDMSVHKFAGAAREAGGEEGETNDSTTVSMSHVLMRYPTTL